MVLPLLALTWMSAVLAVTDRRSALFQILFAVFDSLEGFVIVMVHCILRREVGWRGRPAARSGKVLGGHEWGGAAALALTLRRGCRGQSSVDAAASRSPGAAAGWPHGGGAVGSRAVGAAGAGNSSCGS